MALGESITVIHTCGDGELCGSEYQMYDVGCVLEFGIGQTFWCADGSVIYSSFRHDWKQRHKSVRINCCHYLRYRIKKTFNHQIVSNIKTNTT